MTGYNRESSVAHFPGNFKYFFFNDVNVGRPPHIYELADEDFWTGHTTYRRADTWLS